MKVIVVGMGKTGLTLIEMLTKEGIDVTSSIAPKE